MKYNHLLYTEVHSLFYNEVQLIVQLKYNIYFTAEDNRLFYSEIQLITVHRTEVQPFILHRHTLIVLQLSTANCRTEVQPFILQLRTFDCITMKYS